ncbi:Hexokinase-3 [Trebouxia sp. C0009 RCD-2024]
MAGSEEEPITSVQATKGVISQVNSDQDLKEPVLTKRGSAPLATAPEPKPRYVGLPTFDLHLEGLGGKKLAAVWVTTCLLIYFGGLPLCQFCRILPYHDPAAAAAMEAEVPHTHFTISAAVFTAFFFVNLLPLAYETGSAKQQLSILLSFVKLISAYVDYEVTQGGGVIVFDAVGRPMLLHRHFQWLTTSSTLVYCVSKMSDYSQAEVARLVGLQASLICTGTAATLMTSAWKWPLMIYTLISFAIVQIGIWRMINTAREACSDGEQRRRLQFLRNITPHVWNTFPAMWFCQYFGILSVFQAECGNMLGNFVAKALLSSSIMFSNFMSIYQRRAEAKEKAEQSNRLSSQLCLLLPMR